MLPIPINSITIGHNEKSEISNRELIIADYF